MPPVPSAVMRRVLASQLLLAAQIWQAASVEETIHAVPDCLTEQSCLEMLEAARQMRQQREAYALDSLHASAATFQNTSALEERSQNWMRLTQHLESAAATWESRVTQLQKELRPLEQGIEAASSGAKAADRAEQRAEAAETSALHKLKRQGALSGMPAKERCRTDMAACGAGLLALQLRQWLQLLHAEGWQLLIALASMLLGAALLVLPARAQAASFGAATLVLLPVLTAGAFKDFLLLVSDSPPSLGLLRAEGFLTAVLAVCFLWQGADGLRLLLGAGLGMFLGSLALAALSTFFTLPATAGFVAACTLGSLALSLAGAAAGLRRRRATQAFALAVPGGLLVSSGALLLQGLLTLSGAFWDDVVAALMPWPDAMAEKEVGSFVCRWGRLLWLVLIVPSLVRFILLGSDVEPFPWEVSDMDVPREVEKQEVQPDDTEGEADRNGEACSTSAVVPGEAAPSANEDVELEAPKEPEPGGTLPLEDTKQATELISQMVQTLAALKEALPKAASGSGEAGENSMEASAVTNTAAL
eukprot:TRINITY_DN37579_c0_g1_i1.p1 TRINITY_DN37579_c0_g1~~TRINITY_DN37579_c0_g1_i1.p1  ORF type:complete len:532 (+),score=156.84 TRINITY_DN37579_c0_g1_i1:30-1625(+)